MPARSRNSRLLSALLAALAVTSAAVPSPAPPAPQPLPHPPRPRSLRSGMLLSREPRRRGTDGQDSRRPDPGQAGTPGPDPGRSVRLRDRVATSGRLLSPVQGVTDAVERSVAFRRKSAVHRKDSPKSGESDGSSRMRRNSISVRSQKIQRSDSGV